MIGYLFARGKHSPIIRAAQSRGSTIYLQIHTFYRASSIRALPRITRDTWQAASIARIARYRANGARVIETRQLARLSRLSRERALLRACANRRVVYVSKHSRKAVQSLWELPSMTRCQPIGAASKPVVVV